MMSSDEIGEDPPPSLELIDGMYRPGGGVIHTLSRVSFTFQMSLGVIPALSLYFVLELAAEFTKIVPFPG